MAVHFVRVAILPRCMFLSVPSGVHYTHVTITSRNCSDSPALLLTDLI